MHNIISRSHYPHKLFTCYWIEKAGFHVQNSKTYFSPSNDSCTHELTIQPGTGPQTGAG